MDINQIEFATPVLFLRARLGRSVPLRRPAGPDTGRRRSFRPVRCVGHRRRSAVETPPARRRPTETAALADRRRRSARRQSSRLSSAWWHCHRGTTTMGPRRPRPPPTRSTRRCPSPGWSMRRCPSPTLPTRRWPSRPRPRSVETRTCPSRTASTATCSSSPTSIPPIPTSSTKEWANATRRSTSWRRTASRPTRCLRPSVMRLIEADALAASFDAGTDAPDDHQAFADKRRGPLRRASIRCCAPSEACPSTPFFEDDGGPCRRRTRRRATDSPEITRVYDAHRRHGMCSPSTYRSSGTRRRHRAVHARRRQRDCR